MVRRLVGEENYVSGMSNTAVSMDGDLYGFHIRFVHFFCV